MTTNKSLIFFLSLMLTSTLGLSGMIMVKNNSGSDVKLNVNFTEDKCVKFSDTVMLNNAITIKFHPNCCVSSIDLFYQKTPFPSAPTSGTTNVEKTICSGDFMLNIESKGGSKLTGTITTP
jgi:hypothetical protein